MTATLGSILNYWVIFTILWSLFLAVPSDAKADNEAVKSTMYLSEDQDVLFTFDPERLMFYAPCRENVDSILEVADLIEANRNHISSGRAVVVVRGYSSSFYAQHREPSLSYEACDSKIHVLTPWYIKTNLISDLALMPSLEVEYRINRNWSAAVEGNVAWWKDTPSCQFYQLATIVPEARWWFHSKGPRKGHYIGLFLGGGWYDLENRATGYKGEGILTGLSYGYMFPIGRHLAFEAGIGLGYMNTWYEVYEPIDGCFVYQESRVMNYIGPVRLKFALVWNIGFKKKVGGSR